MYLFFPKTPLYGILIPRGLCLGIPTPAFQPPVFQGVFFPALKTTVRLYRFSVVVVISVTAYA